ncbi:centromere protein X isoform X2 [Tenrec ecaudatus]|uniref:centromere protein X isoform X2 n=1 Tax=Tenrec ecaudatus TaxID=94439 RepID=UPI003F598DE9
MEGQGAGFRKELVSKLLCLHFRDKKTRVSTDAVQLMAEMLRIFVVASGLLESCPAHHTTFPSPPSHLPPRSCGQPAASLGSGRWPLYGQGC